MARAAWRAAYQGRFCHTGEIEMKKTQTLLSVLLSLAALQAGAVDLNNLDDWALFHKEVLS